MTGHLSLALIVDSRSTLNYAASVRRSLKRFILQGIATFSVVVLLGALTLGALGLETNRCACDDCESSSPECPQCASCFSLSLAVLSGPTVLDRPVAFLRPHPLEPVTQAQAFVDERSRPPSLPC